MDEKKSRKKCACILFVNPRRKVLLILRDDRPDIPFPNCWDLPGGHVEQGESFEECIRREMKEEIGVELARPTLFGINDLPDRMERVFWQEADFQPDEITLTEGQRIAWFSEAEIRALKNESLAFGYQPLLLDFFTSRPFDRAEMERRE